MGSVLTYHNLEVLNKLNVRFLESSSIKEARDIFLARAWSAGEIESGDCGTVEPGTRATPGPNPGIKGTEDSGMGLGASAAGDLFCGPVVAFITDGQGIAGLVVGVGSVVKLGSARHFGRSSSLVREVSTRPIRLVSMILVLIVYNVEPEQSPSMLNSARETA